MQRQLIRTAVLLASLACSVPSAFAIKPPPLPDEAKRLSSAQISALYAGLTVKIRNYTFDVLVTGTVKYSQNMKRHTGRYKAGDETGTFSGPIRVTANNLFCHKESDDGPETCSRVYVHGGKIYETERDSRKVQSMNMPVE